jgi:hypothetical protein
VPREVVAAPFPNCRIGLLAVAAVKIVPPSPVLTFPEPSPLMTIPPRVVERLNL